MTENKQYDVIYEKEPRGQVVTDEGIPCTARTCVTRLNRLTEENEQLKTQLSKINQLIDNKIDEFKNGDYGDLPCNTIHMFLDLKEEIGDFEWE